MEISVGQRVKRRSSVADARKSAASHVLGTVLRPEERAGWVVRWDDGAEEVLSARRIRTYAVDGPAAAAPPPKRAATTKRAADAPAPARSKRPRIKKPPPPSLPPPPPSPANRCEVGCWARAAPQPPAVKAEEAPPESEADEGAAVDEGTEERRLSEGLVACAAAKGAVARSPPAAVALKRRLSWFRKRKAEPEMKVEWHGGAGFGAREEAWRRRDDGTWRALRDEAAAPPAALLD